MIRRSMCLRAVHGLAAVAGAWLLSAGPAVAAASSPAPALGVQRSLGQCPVQAQGEFTAVLDNAAQWSATLRQSESVLFGRSVAWSHERVLVHGLGTRATLGWGVSAQRIQVSSASVLPSVLVSITQPAPGSITASALSRPCVVMTLSRGPWQTVRVANEAGRTLGVARVKRGHPRALPPWPDMGLSPTSAPASASGAPN